ncbi:MAG: phosphoserine phosphatase RsbU/P [Acidobacteriota bacterium]|nr:phosphoserine phosphatase RsbU/P [Acidobacteriota bacterium]
MAEYNNQTMSAAKGLSVVDKLRLLLDITKKISRSLDVEEVVNLVMDTLDQLLRYDAAGIYVVECEHGTDGKCVPSALKRFSKTAVRGYDIGEMSELHMKVGEGLIGHVAKTGEPLIVPDVRLDPRYVNARHATRSEMIAPIISSEEVLGVFDLESDELNAYDEDDLEVLMLLASHVAIILEKAMLYEQSIERRRLQAQLEVARQVQLELLPPRDPKLEGFDISAYNFSTEEVSGDYYDFVPIYDDHLGLVIADVSGKGVPAALLMAFLRASLRAAIQIGYAPNISMAKVNYLLWESTENNQFVTAFYGVLDATNKTLAYANAGHNPPLLMDAEGQARFIERGGIPLGMFRDTRYYEYYVPIEPGQTLVLYTDGATEAAGTDGCEFGRDRLEEKVREGKDLSAKELIKSLHGAILEWTDGRGSSDDVTFVVVKAL